MLVDVKNRKDFLSAMLDPRPTERVKKGIYRTNFNFDHDIMNAHSTFPVIFEDGRVYDDHKDLPKGWFKSPHVPVYGVCDTIEQFLFKYEKILEDSESMFCVGFTLVRKVDQSDCGGWRWHKWGDYIGDKNPQHEYLYDEEDIDQVYCFHIYHITEAS